MAITALTESQVARFGTYLSQLERTGDPKEIARVNLLRDQFKKDPLGTFNQIFGSVDVGAQVRRDALRVAGAVGDYLGRAADGLDLQRLFGALGATPIAQLWADYRSGEGGQSRLARMAEVGLTVGIKSARGLS